MRDTLDRLLYGNPLYAWRLRRKAPEGLRDTPPDPWSGDPALADGVLDGDFPLSGRWVTLGENPWALPPHGPRNQAALHAFGWLADLRARGSNAARDRGRALVDGWIATHERWDPLAWRPDVLGQRLAVWLTSAEFLLQGADAGFRERFLGAAAAQAGHLLRTAPRAAGDAGAFAAVKGLVYAGICLPGMDKALGLARRLLEQAVERQVLPDGGHVARNPSLHLSVLRTLSDIRAVLVAGKGEVPPALLSAIDRMTPMLRAYRHGDGGLALFNGGWEEDRRSVDTALSQAGVRGQAPGSAPHTGFNRLTAGRVAVLVDTGEAPAPPADDDAHAGVLSFEMSVGRQRLVVNCGAYPGDEEVWRTALRGTAAHSTLCVDDTNSMEILPSGRVGTRSPQVTAARGEADDGLWLEASHDGYGKPFGLRHRRHLHLGLGGELLAGEDRLEPQTDGGGLHGFAVRFHLHPHVQASPVGGGKAVLLRLPGGEGWRFEAEGGEVRVEESLYFGTPDQRRRSEQVVVAGRVGASPVRVAWRFAEIPKEG